MPPLRLLAVLPNYNHARYLPAALESVIAQKRPPDELVIVDDASTDDSVEVIHRYLPRLPNVKFERNVRNMGAVAIINRAISTTDATVVCSVNADDVIYPSFFSEGLTLLESYPEAAFFSGRSDLLDESGANLGVFPTPTPLTEPGFIAPDVAGRLLMRDEGWFMGNVSLYRREALMGLGGFPADLHAFNDGFISRVLALRYGACYTPSVLGGWRRLAGGMAWSQTADFAEAVKLAQLVQQRMKEIGIFPPGYPDRWRQRYMFSARCFGLVEARRRASRNRSDYIAALLREWLLVPYWFIRLRPFDFFTVMRRRLAYARGQLRQNAHN